MAKTSIRSASEARLVEAIEALLDVLQDGRMDELSDKEQLAYDLATAALSAVTGKSDEEA